MNTTRYFAALLCAVLTIDIAADQLTELTCNDCRDSSFSRDYGNYAVNQIYGPESEIFVGEVIVINPEGQWVHVDLSFILEDNIISALGDFIGIDLGIPTGEFLIETTSDTTATDSYIIDFDMIDSMGVLPVGEPEPLPGPSIGGSDSSGGGSTGGGGVGAGGGYPGGGGGGEGGGLACTSAGNGDWHCVPY